MPTYMIMSKWTPQGLQNTKQSPRRLDAGRKAFEAAGLKMTHFFMTTGPHDMVAIVEAPDDITLAKAVLATTARGSFTTEICLSRMFPSVLAQSLSTVPSGTGKAMTKAINPDAITLADIFADVLSREARIHFAGCRIVDDEFGLSGLN